jgi:hypothetical protein
MRGGEEKKSTFMRTPNPLISKKCSRKSGFTVRVLLDSAFDLYWIWCSRLSGFCRQPRQRGQKRRRRGLPLTACCPNAHAPCRGTTKDLNLDGGIYLLNHTPLRVCHYPTPWPDQHRPGTVRIVPDKTPLLNLIIHSQNRYITFLGPFSGLGERAPLTVSLSCRSSVSIFCIAATRYS